MVSYTLDTLPPLTDADREELRVLEEKFRNIPDNEIDFTDSPEITPERWAKTIPNPFCRARKEASVS